ncbi:MAG: 4-hydroxy-tetrahydrodipicolinate reductase [Gammaproteobacteria bacterium]
MKKLRILVNGAQGKMGQLACKAIENSNHFELVAQCTRENDLAKTLAETQPDIAIELTNADAVFENTKTIIAAGVRPIVGASGLTEEQMQIISKSLAEKKQGGMIVPNFSLGAVLMMQTAATLAKYFPDVEIIEMHHDGKLDSPSGTAIQTAENINKAKTNSKTAKPGKETLKGARGATHYNIPIHSVRLPGLIAHQHVIFGNHGETLTIRHDTLNRDAFAPGILMACERVMCLNELEVGLDEALQKHK